MSNKITVSGANLPVMQMHIEGTPALVEEARKQLAALGATVIDAEVGYKGSGYTAIETDLEDGVDQLTRRIEDPHYVSGGKVRLLCGYVGPMQSAVECDARDTQRIVDFLARFNALCDSFKVNGRRASFRTTADFKTINKAAVMLECQATPNHLTGRFGSR